MLTGGGANASPNEDFVAVDEFCLATHQQTRRPGATWSNRSLPDDAVASIAVGSAVGAGHRRSVS